MGNGRVDYLHDELRDLRRYISERFDALEQRLASKADTDDLARLSARVASLERWRAWLTGGAAAVGGLLGWLTGRDGHGGG